jgi:cephalosporin hydroxylase
MRALTERKALASLRNAVMVLAYRVAQKLGPSARVRAEIVDQFNRLYYNSGKQTWSSITYRGVRIRKCPTDLWMYQELLHALRPELIVEAGTGFGGSAYYLADLCEAMGTGRVVTIDVISSPERPEHPRITYIEGSSTDAAVVAQVSKLRPNSGDVLVILDSDHSKEHVLDELRVWADWVPVGSYIIVEDTNLNGHPSHPDFGPGPMEAVDAFLAEDERFRVDPNLERLMLTFNPRGYLKRVS